MNNISQSPNGLQYDPEFLSSGESEELLAEIDRGDWLPISEHEGARRVQQFGPQYDYRAARVSEGDSIPWPIWCKDLGDLVVGRGYFPVPPEQAIINEYFPGQGIAAHVDDPEGFGPVVVSITLGSPVTMDFTHSDQGANWSVHLGIGSLVLLSDAARYEWKHGIAKRDFDMVEGRKIDRSRRVSVTYRSNPTNVG